MWGTQVPGWLKVEYVLLLQVAKKIRIQLQVASCVDKSGYFKRSCCCCMQAYHVQRTPPTPSRRVGVPMSMVRSETREVTVALGAHLQTLSVFGAGTVKVKYRDFKDFAEGYSPDGTASSGSVLE